MDALYSSRNALTSFGCSSANALRTTTQPCTRLPASETLSHSAVRSSAAVSSGLAARAMVTIGSGSTAMCTSPEASAVLSSAGWA